MGIPSSKRIPKQNGSKISANDPTVLMNANSGGRTWIVDKSATDETVRWVTDDGSILAEWDKTAELLTVMTSVGPGEKHSVEEVNASPKK